MVRKEPVRLAWRDARITQVTMCVEFSMRSSRRQRKRGTPVTMTTPCHIPDGRVPCLNCHFRQTHVAPVMGMARV
ncbi:hypothetical protein E2C01_007771 [Portunus trituberculatus]|uniref:Uncharacterized protein n=1 Tax=Portunus trituberculatus TaxID=210409 RepID=A0A5B7D1B2_PORTR|nr:hypothetical protein [Portunus trituberculatus]